MLFNILHAAESGALLAEARRVLKVGGKLGVMHWNYDPTTPRGPAWTFVSERNNACNSSSRLASAWRGWSIFRLPLRFRRNVDGIIDWADEQNRPSPFSILSGEGNTLPKLNVRCEIAMLLTAVSKRQASQPLQTIGNPRCPSAGDNRATCPACRPFII